MGHVNLMNAVFYSDTYHPIQAGSIDGTDILSHDNGVHRALLASITGLYDPTSDPNIEGDPYCTIFVGRLSRTTSEEELKKSMEKYGDIKRLRIVRDIVTGASSGYAFVEYETERQMRRAYEGAYASTIDGNQVIVDYCRQRLMPGWIPRRLGGGLGGKKESGQLRFGGRDRPFRAPLRPIPHEELKKLGIPLPPEGHYLSRFELPPLPKRRSAVDYHEKDRYSSRHKERSASFDNLQAEADLQDPNVASRSSKSRDDGGRMSYNRHDDREREDSKENETRKSRKRHHEERGRYESSSHKHDHSYTSRKHSSRSRRSEDSDWYHHACQKSTDKE